MQLRNLFKDKAIIGEQRKRASDNDKINDSDIAIDLPVKRTTAMKMETVSFIFLQPQAEAVTKEKCIQILN